MKKIMLAIFLIPSLAAAVDPGPPSPPPLAPPFHTLEGARDAWQELCYKRNGSWKAYAILYGALGAPVGALVPPAIVECDPQSLPDYEAAYNSWVAALYDYYYAGLYEEAAQTSLCEYVNPFAVECYYR